jgi:hypothetical protein
MLTRKEAEKVWNAAWDACLATERTRAQLEPDEGFACIPREWCFDSFAYNNGLEPRPVISVVTTTGFKELYWNRLTGHYEDEPPSVQEKR